MPIPKPLEIKATAREMEILSDIVNKHSSKQILVKRAKIVLEALSGMNNTEISNDLKVDRDIVSIWRGKWALNDDKRELEQSNDKRLKELVIKILSDKERSGAPPIFTSEQITKIIALACTDPQELGYPINHWTPRELTMEVLKREIVKSISVTSIRRFFKRNGNKTR